MKPFDVKAFRTQALPTETQLQRRWPKPHTEPVISIICMAYNQADYIHDALRGFLLQKTDFPFEIIIHDDVSTDGTREIIAAYAARFPNTIKVIFQSENQYSKYPSSVFLFPARIARGKYLALCEGDDFYTDPEKLQAQYDCAKRNSGFTLFCHPFIEYDCLSSPPTLREFPQEFTHKETHIPARTIIEKGGGIIHTTTMLIDRRIVDELPDWYRECPVFDYVLKIVASGEAGAISLPHTMSLYRFGATGSWTAGLSEAYIQFATKQEISLQRLHTWIRPSLKPLIRQNHARLAASMSTYYAGTGERTKAITYALKAILLARKPKGRALVTLFKVLIPRRMLKPFNAVRG
ncbi:glycosyltransferase family 2 protein [Castellaniella sp.]|uniref:glycosyltransferase family 2 protein n=1 Tax=Castellaniella sp. TaxID=1955812 RepID=UPI003A8DFEFA